MQLILYGTTGCHLCDEAEALLRCTSAVWQNVDIAGDDKLLETYGLHIPVLLRQDSGISLRWPFGKREIVALLHS